MKKYLFILCTLFHSVVHSGNFHAKGMASWYGSESGSRNADGSKFNPNGLSAAHRTLPFGTKIKVTNLKNNKSVIVPVKDRGPFIRGRIVDLSKGAARALGINGVAMVEIEALP